MKRIRMKFWDILKAANNLDMCIDHNQNPGTLTNSEFTVVLEVVHDGIECMVLQLIEFLARHELNCINA